MRIKIGRYLASVAPETPDLTQSQCASSELLTIRKLNCLSEPP